VVGVGGVVVGGGVSVCACVRELCMCVCVCLCVLVTASLTTSTHVWVPMHACARALVLARECIEKVLRVHRYKTTFQQTHLHSQYRVAKAHGMPEVAGHFLQKSHEL